MLTVQCVPFRRHCTGFGKFKVCQVLAHFTLFQAQLSVCHLILQYCIKAQYLLSRPCWYLAKSCRDIFVCQSKSSLLLGITPLSNHRVPFFSFWFFGAVSDRSKFIAFRTTSWVDRAMSVPRDEEAAKHVMVIVRQCSQEWVTFCPLLHESDRMWRLAQDEQAAKSLLTVWRHIQNESVFHVRSVFAVSLSSQTWEGENIALA